MIRELDWRIHELMGNDLTGWEWRVDKVCACGPSGEQYIPHYSSTWEGAGLVMEWLTKINYGFSVGWSLHQKKHRVVVNNTLVYDEFFPLALAKAYISAMEERDND